MAHLAQVVYCIHSSNLTHNGICPNNILLDEDNTKNFPVLVGWSHVAGPHEDYTRSILDSDMKGYIAPEVGTGLPKATQKTDIFSLGMCFGAISKCVGNLDGLNELIEKMTIPDPGKRIDIDAVAAHPVFQGVPFQDGCQPEIDLLRRAGLNDSDLFQQIPAPGSDEASCV
jgi:serine/threonine protein kinase